MAILLTGAAGFIGYHVAEALLARGETVIGVDSVNDYYDPRLKQARLDRLLVLLVKTKRLTALSIWRLRPACGTRWLIHTPMCRRT